MRRVPKQERQVVSVLSATELDRLKAKVGEGTLHDAQAVSSEHSAGSLGPSGGRGLRCVDCHADNREAVRVKAKGGHTSRSRSRRARGARHIVVCTFTSFRGLSEFFSAYLACVLLTRVSRYADSVAKKLL